jgi:hypothetical protein
VIFDCVPSPTAFRRSKATSSRSRTTDLLGPGLRHIPKLAILFLLAFSACGGEGLLLPSAGQPVRIEIVSGDGQIDTVGQSLPESLVVRVTDPEGREVQGIEVVFLAPADAVLAPNDTVFTDANGEAAVQYTLATAAGDQTIEARATPVVATASLDTVFHATAHPEAAVSLVMAGGNEQVGEAGAALADSLAVRAVDRFGNGVGGIEVSWEATGGAVSSPLVVTGPDGRAAVERTLGSRLGSYSTTASASLEGSPVAFTATGVAPPSPRLVVATQPSSNATAGVAFSRQPVIQLQTALGAPLARADVAVTVQIASGGGSLGGRVTIRSTAEGVVTYTDLSIRGEPGERTLIFAASDFTSAISSEIDVAAGPPLPSASSASVPNGTAGAATVITVELKDAFGTPVEGAAGDISVSVSGSNSASSLDVSEQGDGSYSASYTPVLAGTDQVDVRVNGTPVPGSPFVSTVVPGPADPSMTTAVVTRGGFFGARIDAVITTRDAQGNLLGRGGDDVKVQLNSEPPVSAFDHGNGTYSQTFFSFGATTITITLNGVAIAGSPFNP